MYIYSQLKREYLLIAVLLIKALSSFIMLYNLPLHSCVHYTSTFTSKMQASQVKATIMERKIKHIAEALLGL